MEKVNFSIEINAKPGKVWEKLWSDETYPIWTTPFGEDNSVKTDWKEGSRAIFLSASGEGMVSEIDVIRPYEYISFKHLGYYKDGVEDTESDAVKEWAGATENYRLDETEEGTNLHVDVDISQKHRASMEKMFTEALVIVKDLAESDPD